MNSELANILNVPVLTTGHFQGHKGPPVMTDEAKLDRIIAASNRMRPYLQEAHKTGELAGNPDFTQRLRKPLPAYININHDSLEEDKIRDALLSAVPEFRKDAVEGKPWIVEHFSGVDPVSADFIRRYFPKRSIELMHGLKDPETGEEYTDGVIISTAFLDRATRPAVPGQTEDLLVEFSEGEQTATITTDQPMEGNNMPKEDPKPAVDVSELQKEKDTLTAELEQLKA
ncbi:hypothetical protein GF380_00985, partial [Candidatus Uhrbacteria bacterium]|nr:hypothetical protein [Candidatus Uhrbacteria bacterium]